MMRSLTLSGFLVSAAGYSFVLDDTATNTSCCQTGGVFTGATMCASAGHGSAFYRSSGVIEAGQTFFRHRFNVTQDGCYLLEEYHPAVDASGNAGSCSGLVPQSMPLRVDYCRGQTANTVIDQTQGGDSWNEIGMLPFYAGHEGAISVTRDLEQDRHCQDGSCLWLVDAFRFTWLSDSCSGAQRARERVIRERAAMLAEETGIAGETEAPAETGIVADNDIAAELEDVTRVEFGVQATLSDHEFHADLSVFKFQPPLDGCYLLEEQHPHIPEPTIVPVGVNYCAGQRAEGFIDHTDGRHLQWNYLASLPFFDDREGSCELPRSVVERAAQLSGGHMFRLTRAGTSCSRPSAQVFKAHLQIGSASARRLSAGPGSVVDTKAALARLLAPAARVSPVRLSVTDLTSEMPLVAELTVLPSTIAESESLFGTTPTAAEALSNHLRAALATSDLGQQLCGAAGLAGTGCNATLTEVYRAQSQLRRAASVPVRTRTPEEPSFFSGAVFSGAVFAVLGCAAICIIGLSVAACVYTRSKSQRGVDKSQDDVEVPAKECNAAVAEAEITAQKSKLDAGTVQDPMRSSSFSDNASTATPTDDAVENDAVSVHTEGTLDNTQSAAAQV